MAGDEVDRLLCRYMYDGIFVNGDGDGRPKSGSWAKDFLTVAVQVTVRLNSPTCRCATSQVQLPPCHLG